MSIDWYNERGQRPELPAGHWCNKHGVPVLRDHGAEPDDIIVWQNVPEAILQLQPSDAELEAIATLSGILSMSPGQRSHLRLACAYARAAHADSALCKGCGSSALRCQSVIDKGAIKCCPDCTHGYEPTLDELEKVQIFKVMAANQDNKTAAAKVLGIDRRTLYRKLKMYQVQGLKTH